MSASQSFVSSDAEDGTKSPWDAFLERPPQLMPERSEPREVPNVQPTQPTQPSAVDWGALSLTELSERLTPIHEAYHTDGNAMFEAIDKMLATGADTRAYDKVYDTAYGNRSGFVTAIYETCKLALLEDKKMTKKHKFEAQVALEKWHDGAKQLERKFFAFQDSRANYEGHFRETLLDYSKEQMGYYINIQRPERDFAEALDRECTERYAPRLVLQSKALVDDFAAGLFDEAVANSGINELLAVDVVVGNPGMASVKARAMMHPAGLINGLFLPSGLRAQDLNETEKMYVKADLLACAATRSVVEKFHSVQGEALYKFGLRPRVFHGTAADDGDIILSGNRKKATKRKRPTEETPPRKRNKYEDVTEPSASDDMEVDEEVKFYDVYSDDDDTQNQEEAKAGGSGMFSKSELVSFVNLVAAIEKAKERGLGGRTFGTDPLTEFMFDPRVSLKELMVEALQFEDQTQMDAYLAERHTKIEGEMDNMIDGKMLGTFFAENTLEQNRYIGGILRRCSRMILNGSSGTSVRSGVDAEHKDEVRGDIAQYLADNALARQRMIYLALKNAFTITTPDDGDSEDEVASNKMDVSNLYSGNPATPKPAQRKKRRTSNAVPVTSPPPTVPEAEQTPTTQAAAWIESLTKQSANWVNVPNFVVLVGSVVSIVSVALGMDWLTQQGATMTLAAFKTPITVAIAANGNRAFLDQHLEWVKNLVKKEEDLKATQTAANNRFAELLVENRDNVKSLKETIQISMQSADAYRTIAVSYLNELFPRMVIGHVLAGLRISSTEFIDAVRRRAGSAVAPVTMDSVTNTMVEERLCFAMNDVLGKVEEGFKTHHGDGMNIDRNDPVFESADAFLNEYLPVVDAQAAVLAFGECSTDRLKGAYGGIIGDRLSMGEKFFGFVNNILSINEATKNRLAVAAKFFDELQLEAEKAPAAVSSAEVYQKYSDNSMSLSKVVAMARDLSASLQFTEKLEGETIEVVETIARDGFDVTPIRDLARATADLRTALQNSLTRLGHSWAIVNHNFFVELAYLNEVYGPSQVETLYELARQSGKLDMIMTEGRSPVAAFDGPEDKHNRFIAFNATNESIVEATHMAGNPTNYMPPASNPTAVSIMANLMNVLSDADAVRNKSYDEIVEYAKGKTLAFATQSNLPGFDEQSKQSALQMVKDTVMIYELPIERVNLGNGNAVHIPKFRDFNAVKIEGKVDMDAFIRHGVRAAGYAKAVYERDLSYTEKRETAFVFNRNLGGTNIAIIKTINSIGYWKMMMNSATHMVEGLAILWNARGYITSFLTNLCGSGQPKEAQNNELTVADLIGIEEQARALTAEHYVDRMNLIDKQIKRLDVKNLSVSDRFIQYTKGIRNLEWKMLLTDLVSESSAPQEREELASSWTSGRVWQFLVNNPALIGSSLGLALLGINVGFSAPLDYFANTNSAVFGMATGGTSWMLNASAYALGTFYDMATNNWIIGGTSGVSIGTFFLKYYSDVLPDVTYFRLYMDALRLALKSESIQSGVVAFGGYLWSFLSNTLFNIDMWYVSTSYLLYMTTSAEDALYVGGLFIFRATLTVLVPLATNALFNLAYVKMVDGPNFTTLRRKIDELGYESTGTLSVPSDVPMIDAKFILAITQAKLGDYAALIRNQRVLKKYSARPTESNIKTFTTGVTSLIVDYTQNHHKWAMRFSVTKALTNMAVSLVVAGTVDSLYHQLHNGLGYMHSLRMTANEVVAKLSEKTTENMVSIVESVLRAPTVDALDIPNFQKENITILRETIQTVIKELDQIGAFVQ